MGHLRRLIGTVRSGSLRAEARRELEFHVAERVDALMAEGMGREAAERLARRQLGNELRHVEGTRDADVVWWLASVLSDVRHALRGLRRAPGFAFVATATLALGIGASAGMFGVVDVALLRPLPYESPDRLVHVWETHAGDVDARARASYPDFGDWRAQSATFAGFEGYDETNVTVGGRMVRGARVTPGLFDLLGVAPSVGRTFTAEESDAGAPVVVVTDGFWRRELGGAGAGARQVTVDGMAHAVIGVLPRGFRFAPAGDAELWLPLGRSAATRADRGDHWLSVVGRLAEGVDLEGARTELSAVMARLARAHPATNSGRGIALVPLREEIVGALRPVYVVLLCSVGLLLAIATVNVAGLLLARGLARRRELAVRAALGAGRMRLVRQLITETAVLAVAGGLLGVGVARVAIALFVGRLPESTMDSIAYLRDAAVDGRVLLFALAVTIGTALVIGLVPALSADAPSARDVLGSGVRAAGARRTMRDTLAAAEIALTVVLLVAAGAAARSLQSLLRQDPGFDAAGVAMARVALAGAAYAPSATQQRFFERVLSEVRALPGVRQVGAVSQVPYFGGGTNTFRVEGAPEPDPARRPEAMTRGVAGDYFGTLSIPLIAGRTFDARDEAAGVPAVVISAGLAQRLFGDRPAVGRSIRFYAVPDTVWQIVGVVGDVRNAGPELPPPPTIYYSHLQAAENRLEIVARHAGSPDVAARAIEQVVRSIDPAVAVYMVGPLQDFLADVPAVFARSYPLALIGSFGAIALVLAAVGLYGVIALAVRQRTREFGIRLALGARGTDLRAEVLRRTARIALPGIVGGLAAAIVLSRGLDAFLAQFSPIDPATCAGVAGIVAVTALTASWLPAARAARLDPVRSLHEE